MNIFSLTIFSTLYNRHFEIWEVLLVNELDLDLYFTSVIKCHKNLPKNLFLPKLVLLVQFKNM